jgi:hypothetical protein
VLYWSLDIGFVYTRLVYALKPIKTTHLVKKITSFSQLLSPAYIINATFSRIEWLTHIFQSCLNLIWLLSRVDSKLQTIVWIGYPRAIPDTPTEGLVGFEFRT